MKIQKQKSNKFRSTIYAGAYIDDKNQVYFNWNTDDYERDILALATDTSGEFDDNGVRYIYGFEYLPNVNGEQKRAFRNYIKHLGEGYEYLTSGPDQDVDEFVERALLRFDSRYDLHSFEVTVHVEPTSTNTIVDYMGALIADMSTGPQVNFELVKNMYRDVKFDVDKAYVHLKQSNRYTEDKIKKWISKASKRFENLKKNGSLFEMKKFVPRELRDGFENYLKFKTDEERWLYQNLQGVDVLIYDDFLTSGATVREIVRYLRSINDKNTLTVFVLIKQ